jgi:hypothetical protein
MSTKDVLAVDRKILKEFREFVLRRYGRLRGYLGREAEKALKKHIEDIERAERELELFGSLYDRRAEFSV